MRPPAWSRLSARIASVIAFLLLCLGPQAEAGARFESFPVPTTNSWPLGIARGPDGAFWFTEYLGNNIGRVTKDGTITEFPVPTATSRPDWITSGPGGALWFTEHRGDRLGRITTDGTITEWTGQNGGSFAWNANATYGLDNSWHIQPHESLV